MKIKLKAMIKEELEQFIQKLRELRNGSYGDELFDNPAISEIIDSDGYDSDDEGQLDRFMEWIEGMMEDNFSLIEYHNEKELFEYFLEQEDAWTNDDWMFPNGKEDD